jgi:hypothetical protein
MWREEALTVREEKALVKVNAKLDIERAKIKATQKEYFDKMEAHTTHVKHSLDLNKMLGDKKV